ncbi:MAG: ribonuclease Z [Candidatus Hydrothermarchaeales archaeon]
MEIIFLGTTAAVPSVERGHSAIALRYLDEVLLWDCGEGTQRQLIRAKISYMKIKKVFVTHFHGDHFLGIPGLIQTMSFAGREEPLTVYGPRGIDKLLKNILALGDYTLRFEVVPEEIDDGFHLEEEKYVIRCLNVEHYTPTYALVFEEKKGREFLPEKALALGLRPGPKYSRLQCGEAVEHEGRTIQPDDVLGDKKMGYKIVYSSDTRPCSNVIEACKDAVLIHDGTFDEERKKNAIETMHSTCAEAAEVARKGGAKSLYLTHISPRYKDTEVLLNEARKIFDNSRVARDFLKVEM